MGGELAGELLQGGDLLVQATERGHEASTTWR
jgi:hypothetical protein